MPKTVLLADDSAAIHRIVALTFADEDVRIVSVEDGDQAVAALQQSPPDLVLADVDMPGRSGYEVAEFVRSQPALSSLPVLLLIGAFDAVDRERAVLVGADGILAKPFDPAVLVGRVLELLTVGRGGAPVVQPPAAIVGSWSAPIPDLSAPVPVPDASALDPEDIAPSAPFETVFVPTPESAAEARPDVDRRRPSATPDAYFDEIDRAFAQLSTLPRTSPHARQEEPEVDAVDGEEERRTAQARLAAVPPLTVPITDAFTALLDAERIGRSAPSMLITTPPTPTQATTPVAVTPAHPAAAPSAPTIDLDALAEKVARLVLAQLSDHVIRDTVTGIVSATAERLVVEEIERIKRNIK